MNAVQCAQCGAETELTHSRGPGSFIVRAFRCPQCAFVQTDIVGLPYLDPMTTQGGLGDMLVNLADVQGQIAEIRRLAKILPPSEADACNWIADEIEARARDLDQLA